MQGKLTSIALGFHRRDASFQVTLAISIKVGAQAKAWAAKLQKSVTSIKYPRKT
jgi:hypothetical protein